MISSYHMQYGHVSSTPFSPPVSYRTTKRRNPGKRERTHILEGKCHKCKKWIPVESLKELEIKVKEICWYVLMEPVLGPHWRRWKHGAAYHQGTHIEGDNDFFEDDDVYHKVRELDR